MTVILTIVVAKAQLDTGGFHGWVVKDVYLLPALCVLTLIMLLLAVGQYKIVAEFYWRVFGFFIPNPHETEDFSGADGLVIKAAQWRCTVYKKARDIKTRAIQGRVQRTKDGYTLNLLAHNDDFGDVCKLHGASKERPGDPKELDVAYFYQGRITVKYCHEATINFRCSQTVVKRDDLFK